MMLRQLFDRSSCTYTYLLADGSEALLIDPVFEHARRDAALIRELGLTLRYTLETHVHADHITASGTMRQRVGSKSVLSAAAGADCADITVNHGDAIEFGSVRIEVRATPGHTSTCVSYYLPKQGMIFTGDALMIRGCGRTDFQEGSAETLYDSVHGKLFTLPPKTLVYPAHDYKGRRCSTIGEEMRSNPRLTKTKSEFVDLMANLGLPYPMKIDASLPANLMCGIQD